MIFALSDCNNFYASVERVFNPKLEGKPVVVLSNNDGVIIARSNEAKALGIKMATPIFKVQHIIDKHRVHVFSSNYVLYGDMSHRVISVLRESAPEIEIYSIDEAFLKLDGIQENFTNFGRNLRDKVKKWTGIPISVGIADTKTLTKVANELAKKDPKYNGVLDISGLKDAKIDPYLERLDISDVWGIGRRLSPMLRVHGIRTARDLKYASDQWIRKCINVLGLKTVHELRGISCIQLEENPAPKKSIASTRSFGRPVQSLTELKQAVAMYVTTATEKLREGRQVASAIQVFIHTNYHRQDQAQYANSTATMLPQPTSHSPTIVRFAHKLLEQIYKPGYKYKKAGIILTKLMPKDQIQLDLFKSHKSNTHNERIMQTLDKINAKHGRNTLSLAALGLRKPWKMRQLQKSKRFTTKWNETIRVNVDR
ncbi:Y-family DNA polymerase [Patescibacteria group bacterium]